MKLTRMAAAIALTSLVLTGCSEQEQDVKTSAPAVAQAPAAANSDQAKEAFASVEQKVSYGLGLQSVGMYPDELTKEIEVDAYLAGVMDGLKKNNPQVSELELQQASEVMFKRLQEKMDAENAKAAQAGKDFLAENTKKEGITTTESGLQYQILSKGDGKGAKPVAQDIVKVHYTGTLIDGTVFDSSVERGTPLDIPVGAVIPGWQEGLQLMQVGDKFKFFIPSDLAYGPQSPSPMIPANAVLVFEVELININPTETEQEAADQQAAQEDAIK